MDAHGGDATHRAMRTPSGARNLRPAAKPD